ncbi:ABC transporter G family member 20 [Bacillus rossius redtenbacheri]|uniref:ABC transporter G family member 20 n=1 Tax=Bacillus rossius redtenbacheri TaxID=93214 RepID=UPI002FDE375B
MSDQESIDEVPLRRRLQTQQSTVFTRRQQAVCVRRAYKHYGNKRAPTVVLEGLNMTVPKGCIYGLLGASGCGKTTLLSCIVGRRRLNSGEIWVLGGKPGSSGSGVPGPRIGYMPQEIALYGEFTIQETLVYYGWIAGMSSSQVEQKIDFLLKLLQMPPSSRFVKNLSGGQQRRVSFAAALVHDPELLILDEPTVGVDPVLRQSIWDYLVSITEDGRKTVIITTHYIDETRQAGIIGLMRGGRFLAEESPDSLMTQHMCSSLEDVFLKLSKLQNMKKRRRSTFMKEVMGPIAPEDSPDVDTTSEISGEFGDNISVSIKDMRTVTDGDILNDMPPEDEVEKSKLDCIKFLTLNRMKALIWKNFLWMWRNVGVMMFIIGLPVVQIVVFCLSIGRDPKGLHLAVYNEELNHSQELCIPSTGCDLMGLSCRYLAHLQSRNVLLDYHDSLQDARQAVQAGRAWGALYFSSNYSDSLVRRLNDVRGASELTLDQSEMKVWMDMSNQQIGQLLNRDLILAYMNFTKDVLGDCKYNTKVAELPVRLNDPVYGYRIPNFTDFAAPGVILTIIFFLAVALTSGAMLIERNEGMLERSLVCGITSSEILFSHVVTQFVVMCGQTSMVLVFSFLVFNITCEGHLVWVVLLTMLTGLCGMCFGFVVSCLCDNERTATYLALGSFLPIVMLCGIIWPVEGMHGSLKIISFLLPLTKSTESLRTILARGWAISQPTVYFGFVATMLWMAVFLVTSILVLKFKKG